nr:ISL3 family transposase [Myxosarcina sp. GI1]
MPQVGLILHTEVLSKEANCTRCGNKSQRIHQNHRYLIKDLSISGQPVYLELNRRQFKCGFCQKPFSEELNFVQKRRKYTSRLATEIIRQVLADDIKTVAQNNDVSTEEIETMLKDKAQELKQEKPSKLKRLGIDEIALVKGQGNYCAVLVDLEKSKVVDILEERSQEKIMSVLTSWGTEVLQSIEYVSIDLWKPYKSLARKLMPNAEVVANRFHVMKQVNEELDEQRKTQKREVKKEKSKKKKQRILSGLSKSKYALLKNEDNLSEKQQEKLNEVKIVCPTLGKMHELKEKFRDILQQKQDSLTGLLKISDWLKEAQAYYPEAQKTIIRWIGEIIAYFDQRVTNGVVEGINNKLKLIKRAAYGFRNFGNFRDRVLLTWHFNC